MSYITDSWELAAKTVIKKFEKRSMNAYYCATKEEAKDKILELIPKGAVITAGGSESMAEAGVMDAVKGPDYQFIDRTAGKDFQETREIYSKAVLADYFLMSTNAFTEDGELVNIDGMGNRVACLCYGPSHVIVLASMNKMCRTLDDAVNRAHTLACPPNAIRVKASTPCSKTGICADCLGSNSICCQTVITRNSKVPGRITVILVGEPLGF
ncbi:MAG: lactate utilization protein [Blautia sp.]|jgi:hypothetical protein